MRRGQGLGREVDRQQHATAGYIHEPSLEPPLRRWPRINRGPGSMMPATRSPESGTRDRQRRDGWRCQRDKPRPCHDLITAPMSQVLRLRASGLTVEVSPLRTQQMPMQMPARIANRPKRHNGAQLTAVPPCRLRAHGEWLLGPGRGAPII
jgi:hypothetical protein